MGLGSFTKRLGSKTLGAAKGVGRVAAVAARSPVGKMGMKVAGRVLLPIAAAQAGYDIYKSVKGTTGNKGVPALPPMPGGRNIQMGKTAGGAYAMLGGDRNPGLLPRGPGGKLALPFNNPDVVAALQPFALDDQFLRPYYRAPKGYVVLYDPNGKPFPVLKAAAKAYGLWKPHKKPPISVRDWQALKRADRTVKKLGKIAQMGKRIKNNPHAKKAARKKS